MSKLKDQAYLRLLKKIEKKFDKIEYDISKDPDFKIAAVPYGAYIDALVRYCGYWIAGNYCFHKVKSCFKDVLKDIAQSDLNRARENKKNINLN